jgi:hypothetical protein
MSWRRKLSKGSQWVEYTTALENDAGVALTNVLLRAQWQPSVGARPEAFNFAVFIGSERVYAIDVAPLGKHKNNKGGRDRPKFDQHISGVHEHTWSDDGDGYAEDIDVPNITDLQTAWSEFLRRANIEYTHEFVHADPARAGGQDVLGLQ